MYGRQSDWPCPDDRDHVARPYAAVEHPDLITGRQDVRQHQDLLAGGTLRHPVGRCVGKRHPAVLGLSPVDLVAEDPAAAAEALPAVALAAEPAGPAC